MLYLSDPDVTMYHGHALSVLRTLPSESVDCIVTSPPYWGLRDYGVEGQIGLEDSPEIYAANLAAVFREAWRVLEDSGTLWVNLGDSYVSDPGKGGSGPGAKQGAHVEYGRERMAQVRDGKAVHGTVLRPFAVAGLKPKNLVGIPWKVAFALQEGGWYLRSDIIWSKPNQMPESVTDRPTKAHEYLFLLTKQPTYFFDQDAVREKYADGPGLTGGAYSPPGQSPHGNARGPDGRRKTTVLGQDGSIQHRDGERWPNGGRNVRSVWEIPTQPYSEAHFATFPKELVRRCIVAGCPEGGTVLDPFGGSGTTALVAREHGRKAVLIELNESYCELAAKRLQQLSLLAEPA